MRVKQPTHVVFLSVLLAIGMGISFYTYRERTQEQNAIDHARFMEQARAQGIRAQQLIYEARHVLDAFAALFLASEEVTRDEYRAFAQRLLKERPEIIAIHWAPKVLHAERPAYEAKLQRQGLAPQGFFDAPTAADQQQPAAPKPFYFPLYFSEPLESNRKAAGLNILGRAHNADVLQRSARLGLQQTTPAFAVLQDPQGPLAVAIYQPLYPLADQQTQSLSEEQRLGALWGYLILVLRPETLLSERSTISQPNALSVRLIDIETDQTRVIYPASPQPTSELPIVHRHQYPLEIPGRTWVLELSAPALEENIMPELLLSCMLMLSIVVIGAMAMGISQMSRLQLAYQALEKQSAALNKLARTDVLTGLPNRVSLQEQANLILANEDRLNAHSAICMLDLDNFKQVNDQFGHPLGDQLLQEVAKIFKRGLRKGDIAARLGGDEFVLVFPMLNSNTELTSVLQRILKQIQDSATRLTQGQVKVSASIGIALSSPECRTFDTLLHQADLAMYEAKKQGKNGYRFYQDL